MKAQFTYCDLTWNFSIVQGFLRCLAICDAITFSINHSYVKLVDNILLQQRHNYAVIAALRADGKV